MCLEAHTVMCVVEFWVMHLEVLMLLLILKDWAMAASTTHMWMESVSPMDHHVSTSGHSELDMAESFAAHVTTLTVHRLPCRLPLRETTISVMVKIMELSGMLWTAQLTAAPSTLLRTSP